jgi:hypothetical protein
MKADTDSETLDYNAILTQLITRDSIAFSRRESFKSYTITTPVHENVIVAKLIKKLTSFMKPEKLIRTCHWTVC